MNCVPIAYVGTSNKYVPIAYVGTSNKYVPIAYLGTSNKSVMCTMLIRVIHNHTIGYRRISGHHQLSENLFIMTFAQKLSKQFAKNIYEWQSV